MRGAPTPSVRDLAKVSDRLSFVYLEQCLIHKDQNAVTAQSAEGTVHIPVAMLGALLLGPGTRVTHAAMALLGESGASVIWVGEGAVRFYAAGRPMARSSRLLEAQARAFANQHTRLKIARAMYEYRFPDEEVSQLTMQQLRGREGARVRRIYRDNAERTGVQWRKRNYVPGDLDQSDPINRALSSANSCLYGVVAAVIHGLGMSPGLGFVHVGHDLSFVYDVADLVKAETSIPAAFDTVASGSDDPVNDVRRVLRDRLLSDGTLDRCVAALRELFLPEGESEFDFDFLYNEALSLWAGRGETRLEQSVNYASAKT